MTFLNPFVLFGLATAAIPLILHLLSLRKLRTIEFSTLTFLKELQQTRIRRLKLRQILLLIIRTLLVILIVLAFARPALRGTIIGSLGSHAHSSVVIILDDSFSMSIADENGERFKQAKDAALNLVPLLKDGDEAFLVKLSDVPVATTDPALHDFRTLQALIGEAEVSAIRRPLEDALRLTARLLAQSVNANKEVYIISDIQRTLIDDHVRQLKSQGSSLFDERVTFFVVPIGSSSLSNVGIDSVRLMSTILEKAKPVTMRAWVRNYSPSPLHDYVISVYLDSVKAAQRNVSADAYASATTEFTMIPKRSGFIRGYAELEHDALEEDDRRYFSLFIPNRLTIALVANSAPDIQYPLLALHAESDNAGQSALAIVQTTTQKFSSLDLKNVDVLMCAALSSFNENDIERIQHFVERGGGLILFPEPDLEKTAAPLLTALHIPAIDKIVKTGTAQAGLSFEKIDHDHPLFATVFEEDSRHKLQQTSLIESPIIASAVQRRIGKEGHAIVTMTGGIAFLSEHTLGNGKILVYSVAPVLSWSDFPLKGIFAPLMYRSVLYTTSHDEGSANYAAGDEPFVSLRSRSAVAMGGQWKLISPDGMEELLHPSSSLPSQSGFMPASTVQLPKLKLAGIYTIVGGSAIHETFAVNADNRESETRIASADELASLWNNLGISPSALHTISKGEQLQPTILQSRFGIELWKHCVIVALLLALMEMLIARDSRKSLEPVAV